MPGKAQSLAPLKHWTGLLGNAFRCLRIV